MRLEEKFKQLKKEGRKAFIAYVPFGFPNIKTTKSICLSLQEAGVDIIEIGFPFSDPLADGPIIQKATTTALEKGVNADNFFKEVARLKKVLNIPVVIMSYYNPIFQFGVSNFLRKLKKIGVLAITIVDLPLEESASYIKEARKFRIDTIFFITPTTSKERIARIANVSRGFIYYISVTGITGPKSLCYSDLELHLKSIKKNTQLPVCVGFGIHTKEQVARISKFSDGVIVGSSIVKFIERNYREKDFLNKLKNYIRSLQDK